jgi:hypothetical protein
MQGVLRELDLLKVNGGMVLLEFTIVPDGAGGGGAGSFNEYTYNLVTHR